MPPKKDKKEDVVVMCYCVKCRTKVAMKNPVLERTKKGGYMYKGECGQCGGKTAVITSATNVENKD